MSSRLRTAAALVPLVLGSCQQLPELEYETEHLRIGTEFDIPLCRGDLDRFEHVVTTLEEVLDTRVEDPIEVYLWADWEPEVPPWCDDPELEGCYWKGKIHSSLYVLEHELVHAVLDKGERRPVFWEEGAAEALQGERNRISSSTPSANLGAERGEVDFATAGHFSRWLIETRGMELYRELLAAEGSPEQMFENTYAMPFAEAEAEYMAEAPHSYGAYISCSQLALAQLDAMRWSETIDVSCSEPSVRTSPTGLYAHRVLTITERGEYEVSSSGHIQRCRDDAYEVEPSLDQPELYGDVPAYTQWYPTGYFKQLPAGEPQVLDLTPGRYLITAGAESFEAAEVTVDVQRMP